MQFDQKKTIYLQIADMIMEKILKGSYPEGEKIDSIRSLAVAIQVNPNTVQRTYELLQNESIISTKRGLGYFVNDGAKKRIMKNKRETFMNEELPEILKTMDILEIDIETLNVKYQAYLKHKENKS